MTEAEVIELFETKFWEKLTHEERFIFQINEERLCMPFEVFHEAAEVALDRPVWTHEFGSNGGLKEEYEGKRPRATMADVFEKLPKDKRVIIVTDTKEEA